MRTRMTRRLLTSQQQHNYQALLKELRLLTASTGECEGDGNLDLIVESKDLIGWSTFSRTSGGNSSWYDVNLDGLTNTADLMVILQNYGNQCKSGG